MTSQAESVSHIKQAQKRTQFPSLKKLIIKK